ncbi:hypothetical protein SK854_00545 [Lentzea sp. BCCO 10_0061]|uniref:Uncharacterized protein n=1 Tax=Lentzea sokolovensis TaxID=3095429 RepID=A0ABU4UN39_9PSEU|nr:hypothetical protein [Lentzea sp. BCCO 10_0061]MDX8140582.1 hypothetical protein [Lentzea sp. BCCO 10_0061]
MSFAAVIAAHDRSLRLLPVGHQLTGQLAMMFTMACCTFAGLHRLFGFPRRPHANLRQLDPQVRLVPGQGPEQANMPMGPPSEVAPRTAPS